MRFLPQTAKLRWQLVAWLVALPLLLTILLPSVALAADEYNCDTYGGGNYSSCPTSNSGGGSSSNGNAASNSSTDSGDGILLNDFVEYLNSSGDGKTLDLKQGQKVEFILDDVMHTATVKEVGTDYVIITIASDPFDVTVKMKETVLVDVNKDGKDDISIRLNSITNGLASLTFKQLSQNTGKTPVPIATPTEKTAKKNNWLLWGSLLLVLIAVAVVIWLLLKRRKRNSDINGSPPPTVIGPKSGS